MKSKKLKSLFLSAKVLGFSAAAFFPLVACSKSTDNGSEELIIPGPGPDESNKVKEEIDKLIVKFDEKKAAWTETTTPKNKMDDAFEINKSYIQYYNTLNQTQITANQTHFERLLSALESTIAGLSDNQLNSMFYTPELGTGANGVGAKIFLSLKKEVESKTKIVFPINFREVGATTGNKVIFDANYKPNPLRYFYTTSTAIAKYWQVQTNIKEVGERKDTSNRTFKVLEIPYTELQFSDQYISKPLIFYHYNTSDGRKLWFRDNWIKLVDVFDETKSQFSVTGHPNTDSVYFTETELNSWKLVSIFNEPAISYVGQFQSRATDPSLKVFAIKKTNLESTNYLDNQEHILDVFSGLDYKNFKPVDFKKHIDNLSDTGNVGHIKSVIKRQQFPYINWRSAAYKDKLQYHESTHPNLYREVKVVSIADGDTFSYPSGVANRNTSVRLKGFDTPEKEQSGTLIRLGDNNMQADFGERATVAAKNYVWGSQTANPSPNANKVWLIYGGTDKYNREINHSLLPNGINFASIMVGEGYGIAGIHPDDGEDFYNDPLLVEVIVSQLHAAYHQKGMFDPTWWAAWDPNLTNDPKSKEIYDIGHPHIKYKFSYFNMGLIYPVSRGWSFERGGLNHLMSDFNTYYAMTNYPSYVPAPTPTSWPTILVSLTKNPQISA